MQDIGLVTLAIGMSILMILLGISLIIAVKKGKE